MNVSERMLTPVSVVSKYHPAAAVTGANVICESADVRA
jgi:hypothetical protein